MSVKIIIDEKEYSVEAARAIWEKLNILFRAEYPYTIPYVAPICPHVAPYIPWEPYNPYIYWGTSSDIQWTYTDSNPVTAQLTVSGGFCEKLIEKNKGELNEY